MSTTEQTRGRGRPRTKPVGATKRDVYLTDDEAERVSAKATAAGVSAAEWMRRTILKAAGK